MNFKKEQTYVMIKPDPTTPGTTGGTEETPPTTGGNTNTGGNSGGTSNSGNTGGGTSGSTGGSGNVSGGNTQPSSGGSGSHGGSFGGGTTQNHVASDAIGFWIGNGLLRTSAVNGELKTLENDVVSIVVNDGAVGAADISSGVATRKTRICYAGIRRKKAGSRPQ
jgi:hypothetical protein